MSDEARPPFPFFTDETARQEVGAAEDAWNSRDPACVAPAYAADSQWRSRTRLLSGRTEIVGFLAEKWAAEQEYRLIKLIKELWAHQGVRVAGTLP